MYPQVVSGLGKLKNYQLELNINDSVTPVAQPIRRIPFSRRDKVAEKSKEMKKDIMIQSQTFPSRGWSIARRVISSHW